MHKHCIDIVWRRLNCNMKKFTIMKKFVLSVFVMAFITSCVFAQNYEGDTKLDEKAGDTIPMNLQFTDSHGNKVTLADVIDKPTILMLVYYECPGICAPLMADVASVIPKVDLIPGKDYQMVSISFDHEEDYTLAADKKPNYVRGIKGNFPDDAWKFLTGDSVSIAKLTESVGFGFKEDEKNPGFFIHPTTLIILTKDGMVSRYLLGRSFLPFDIKMSVLEASEGNIQPTLTKFLEFCFSYDPEGKQYALNITRIAGVIILFFMGIFIVALVITTKKKRKEKKVKKHDNNHDE